MRIGLVMSGQVLRIRERRERKGSAVIGEGG